MFTATLAENMHQHAQPRINAITVNFSIVLGIFGSTIYFLCTNVFAVLCSLMCLCIDGEELTILHNLLQS